MAGPYRRNSMKPNLETKIKNLTFKSPITVASGTFGVKNEVKDYINYEHLGAMITKTITVRPRKGNPMPRICETTGGMLNAIGLQNKGLEDFLEHKIPHFKKLDVPLIVNVAGEKPGDFEELAKSLDKEKKVVRALELNLSCPNVEAGGTNAMKKRKKMIDIVKAVRANTDLVIFAKLSPELGDVVSIAGDIIKAGADGLSLINTLKGMAVDIHTRGPRIANVTGGLSGPAIKPVALRYVYEVKKEHGVPIIASGGIATVSDCLEFLIVGADLLAIGTANFRNPTLTMDLTKGISDYMKKNKISSLDELRGSFKDPRG